MMKSLADAEALLATLARKPSRASAAAIGHHYVLNGSPPVLSIRAMEMLSTMMCDWVVAILEMVVMDKEKARRVREHALGLTQRLVLDAIRRGYGGLKSDVVLHTCMEDLCNHLSQAACEGVFGDLPDF